MPDRSNWIQFCCRVFAGAMLFVLLFDGENAAGGERLRCAKCNRLIDGQYLQYQGKPYCSKSCAMQMLPKCANCGKPCEGRHILSDNLHFCNEACLSAKLIPHCRCCGKQVEKGMEIYPPEGREIYCEHCFKSLPHCFVCSRPGRHRKLADGRFLCRLCGTSAVNDQYTTKLLFADVRGALVRQFRFSESYEIPVFLVATNDPHITPEGISREFGLYRYQAKLQIARDAKGKCAISFTDEQWDIRLLSSVPEIRLKETIAHELAHDYMRRRWPYIRDTKVQEGFAEYIASCYNQIQRHPELNLRMEKNPDPVYGNGYRETCARVKQGGLAALYRYFDQCNQAGRAALLKEHGF